MDDKLEINLTNLGDVTGCTIVASVTETISVEQALNLRDHLKKELPEAAHILVVCNGVDVSVDSECGEDGQEDKT